MTLATKQPKRYKQIDNLVCEKCLKPIEVGQDYSDYSEDGTVKAHTICLEMTGAIE